MAKKRKNSYNRFDSADDFWSWLHAIPERHVNLSSSFMTRSRCRFCGDTPKYYYNTRKPSFYKTPYEQINHYDWGKKYYKNGNIDQDLGLPPSVLTKVDDLFHSVTYKSFAPRLYRTQSLKTSMVECATCSCFMTAWIFPHMYNTLPENLCRRARNVHSVKLTYQ